MAAPTRALDPNQLHRNPENPRLIFHVTELAELEDSIRNQGILVPLTVFEDGRRYTILDGERRWRCALKLNLRRVPVIIQPKPDRLTNIMMMFAIHNTRKQWDPLPTANKLAELRDEFRKRNRRDPSEVELGQMASLSRGETRRLLRILGLPEEFRTELMEELHKPRDEQILKVDHVLEVTKGVASLRRRDIVDDAGEHDLNRMLVTKFRQGVLNNTVAPRKLARIGRAVERGEVSMRVARREARRLTDEPSYTIDDAFRNSVEHSDFEHAAEQLAARLVERLVEHEGRGYLLGPGLRSALQELQKELRKILTG